MRKERRRDRVALLAPILTTKAGYVTRRCERREREREISGKRE